MCLNIIVFKFVLVKAESESDQKHMTGWNIIYSIMILRYDYHINGTLIPSLGFAKIIT